MRTYQHVPDTVGVDKVVLFTKDFMVQHVQDSGMQLIPGAVDMSTGKSPTDVPLFRDGRGRPVVGSRVIRNTDLYNLTINGYGLKLQFNPSKPYHPHKLADDDDVLRSRILNVVDDLESRGITADWSGSTLTRLDLARNVQLDKPVQDYSQVWSWLRMRRAKNVRQYPDGFGSSNGGTGVIMYDKGKESRLNDDRGLPGMYEDDNLLRCELQFKRSRSIQSNLGCRTLDDLRRFKLDDMAELYKDYVGNKVLTNVKNLDKYTFNFKSDVEILRSLREDNNRSAVVNYLHMMSVQFFRERYKTMEMFEQALDQAGFSRMTRSRQVRAMQKRIAMFDQWKGRWSSVGTMLKELQYRLAS